MLEDGCFAKTIMMMSLTERHKQTKDVEMNSVEQLKQDNFEFMQRKGIF